MELQHVGVAADVLAHAAADAIVLGQVSNDAMCSNVWTGI
jgi:hypothetical protein